MGTEILTAPFEALNEPNYLIGLLCCILLPIFMDVFLFLFFKRWTVRWSLVACEVAFLLGYLFDVLPLLIGSAIIMIVMATYSFIANSVDVRAPFANSMAGKPIIRRNKKQRKGEALFDREEVYGRVAKAVVWMSKKKMGALISFERKDSLNEQMKTGTVVNAPISEELLQTIFYPGTRLHDGAVVIRNDKIAAASVYYTPTTRPLTGKFGSRHRAAIGISEITDSVTVVVSEETGRISIAYQGELNHVAPDQFFDVFMGYMSAKEESGK